MFHMYHYLYSFQTLYKLLKHVSIKGNPRYLHTKSRLVIKLRPGAGALLRAAPLLHLFTAPLF